MREAAKAEGPLSVSEVTEQEVGIVLTKEDARQEANLISIQHHAGNSKECLSPYLPQQEVTESHLSRRANEQVRIGRVTAVQTPTQQGLRYITGHNNRDKTIEMSRKNNSENKSRSVIMQM